MKKNIFFIGVSICLLVLLGVGLSYSMWNMSISQDTNNVIATTNDCFDIAITSQENAITLENAYPISDTKGKSLTPFTFTIKNTCDMAASYSVSLESLKGSTLSSEFLKVMVNENEPKILNSLNSTDIVNTGSIESRVLDTGTIFKNKTIEYSIRLWIDYDTTMEDLDNKTKVLKSRIIVKGVPSDEEEPVPDLLTERIPYLAERDTVSFASDDPDGNIRYIGANPDNYVYFNCSDYSNQSDSTCEKWRIIGLFNNMTKGDGGKENLVKIIRNESIGKYSWDTSSSDINEGKGVNDWTQAALMKLLNPGYESEPADSSLYYNSKNGTCYNGRENSTTSCDFTSIGIRNDKTRNAIESVVWNLGGASDLSRLGIKDFYSLERGTKVYNGRPIVWTGKIGLMYPSDYGYTTSGGTMKSRTDCLSFGMFFWDNSDYNDCKQNSYIFKDGILIRTLTSDNEYPERGVVLYDHGNINRFDSMSYTSAVVVPSLYLKASFKIKAGDGSENSPYQLNIE